MKDNPTTQPNKKLNLKIEEILELKVYLMIARQGNIKVFNEKVIAVMAYDLEGALSRAREEAKELNIIFHGQAIPIHEFISKIYLENIISPPVEIQQDIPKVDMTRQQFLFNLLLAADEFVVNAEDKKQLKEIINKIKNGNK